MGDGPRDAAGADDQHVRATQERDGLTVRPDRQVSPQRIEGRLGVGVGGAKAGRGRQQRVGRAHRRDRVVLLLGELRGRFLVRDRHAVAVDRDVLKALQERRQLAARHPERQVHRVDAELRKRRVVNQRAQAVADRIADHAEHLRLGVDALDVVDLLQLLKRQHARRDLPFLVERGIGERHPHAQAEHPAARAEVAHAERDRRLGRVFQKRHHAQIVGRFAGPSPRS